MQYEVTLSRLGSLHHLWSLKSPLSHPSLGFSTSMHPASTSFGMDSSWRDRHCPTSTIVLLRHSIAPFRQRTNDSSSSSSTPFVTTSSHPIHQSHLLPNTAIMSWRYPRSWQQVLPESPSYSKHMQTLQRPPFNESRRLWRDHYRLSSTPRPILQPSQYQMMWLALSFT